MNERKNLYAAWVRGEDTIAGLCRRFGISRKTGYKWLKRASDTDDDAFRDRSRRPRTNPRAVEPWLVDEIVQARKARPFWGPKKLRKILAILNPRLRLPTVATFAAILKRHGLIRPRRRRPKTPPFSAPLAHATAPNAVWCIDFKGDFAVGRSRCYPLTVTDAYSRYLIACVALRNTRSKTVERVLTAVFTEFGLPDAIRSDNGEPFASKAVAGLSRLSTWWWRLGIRHERIEPAHPEQNGRHERMHGTLKQETASPPERTFAAQQRVFDRFRHVFNDERPHEALGMEVPASFYAASQRRLPEPTWGRDFDYPLDAELLRVSKHGRVQSAAGSFFVSTALAGQLLAMEWTTRGVWTLRFGALPLGIVRRSKAAPRRVQFHPLKEVLPMSQERPEPMSTE